MLPNKIEGMYLMQTVNNVFKWSFYLSSMTGMMILGSIFASWFVIEMLVVLVGITA